MSLLRLFASVFFVFLFSALQAQVNDDFSDGDFLVNPEWTGDTSKFDVNASYELWLNAPPVNDAAYVSTLSQSINNASWECKVRFDFNPSSSNYARFYLVSNQENLGSPLNGYFVQIGSTEDDICLFRQTGSSITKIIDGPDGVLNTSQVNVRIKVLRDHLGNWTLEADTSGNFNFITYGSVLNNDHNQSFYCGIQCVYTSTRSDKFFFDDVMITGLPYNDGIGPKITGVQISASNVLLVDFTEPVLPITAQTALNYFISDGIGNPVSATVNPINNSQVILSLGNNIQPNMVYSMNVLQIQDFQMNIMADTTIFFADYTPVAGDVIINEIMADPTPAVNLPEYEYIELYNSTSFPINLQGWKLKVNNTVRILPSATLLPDSFLVILHVNGLSEFAGIPIIGISSFPSITNNGATISLLNPLDQIIDEVSFTIAWYNNLNADDGGYSLEKMNPFERCGDINNWAATLNINGGTPGKKNSLYTSNLLNFNFKNVDVISADSIRIEFLKTLDTASIQVTDFLISNGIVTPLEVIKENNYTVLLKLGNMLSPNTPYTLKAFQTFTDCAGNTPVADLEQPIMYYIPQLYDIVINEMMVDESPAVLLPPAEYIELYNRNSFPVMLKDYQLSVNNSIIYLPTATIEPDSFIVLVKDTWLQEFQGLPVIGLSSWPSLTNSGATVTLRDRKGKLLHSITYTDKWYQNSSKKDGGWSLEQRDVTKPCKEIDNWLASQDIKGGTPGRTNSVKSLITDTMPPYIYGVGVPHPDTVYVYFKEPIIPTSINNNFFSIIPDSLQIQHIQVVEPRLMHLVLKLNSSLLPNQTYSLVINGSIADCSGNYLDVDTLMLAMPVNTEAQDVIINEILFDPPFDGIDYVEIYNRSESVVDLKNMFIGSGDTLSGNIIDAIRIFPTSMLLFPGEFRLLSTDMNKVLQYYTTKDIKAFLDIASLPAYSNTSGTVTLSDVSQQVIDWLNYSDSWHFPLLNSKDGVSLERINPHASTQDKSNWHSAAQTVGFGTPGYKNSQWIDIPYMADRFKISPEVFSPDQDGLDDLLMIQYNLSEPGFMATIKVYDATGRIVRTLINNQLIGIEGYFTWDGITDDGSKARIGIHVIGFELVNPSGRREEFKIPCVVGGKI